MNKMEKRIDELYQYIEENEAKWRIDHIKRYEYEIRIKKAIEYIENEAGYVDDNNSLIHDEDLLNILQGDDDV